ncbi:putative hexosyltransferase MUCI70 [Cardamine amara subsp. amara]|uniref:Hexosyltransferase MUCI70 n=1 Tax=Cardamine amara subsp. amara TaxID=228776 RepID=A0ABD0Z6D7_CARAN
MMSDFQRSLSVRLSRRGERTNLNAFSKDAEAGFFSPTRLHTDCTMKRIWKAGFLRLLLVGGIVWMLLILVALLFHVWSCQSSLSFFSAICNKEGRLYVMLDTIGFVPKPLHRCPIPVAYDPDKVLLPSGKTADTIVRNLTYITEDESSMSLFPLFGGNISWSEREESFKLKPEMKVHCGFMPRGGAEMSTLDKEYVKKCKFVVATGIFDAYDEPNQPSNINVKGGKWLGIWRLILLKTPPYDEPRRNGKVPKILTHRLFPEAQYSIWIDGKMELIVDPLLILERYLWRGKHTFAIAQHKHHRSIYEEADACKRRKRYARPLVDLQMKIYRYEGLEPWSIKKSTVSDVPEGAVIIREHTAMNNLFSCLWFNEVHLLTPRDQLSFGYVVDRLKGAFKVFMFQNCEYNSLFELHPHIREHSSKIEWVKSLQELKGKGESLKESRGGFGLWTPYPGDLDSVELPKVVRTSKAG